MSNYIVGGLKTALLSAALAVGCSATAIASPTVYHGLPATTVDPTLAPPGLAIDGHLQVVFTFSDAANEDLILTIPSLASNPIIDNHTTPLGTVVDLGTFTNNVVFELQNLKTTSTYFSDALDSGHDYHVRLDANYTDFGVGALSGQALLNVNSLASQGYSIVFMAWEDHATNTHYCDANGHNCVNGSDWDYNDVIYALAYKVNEHTLVPEPLTLSLFGAGLAGAAALRRRRKGSKSE